MAERRSALHLEPVPKLSPSARTSRTSGQGAASRGTRSAEANAVRLGGASEGSLSRPADRASLRGTPARVRRTLAWPGVRRLVGLLES